MHRTVLNFEDTFILEPKLQQIKAYCYFKSYVSWNFWLLRMLLGIHVPDSGTGQLAQMENWKLKALSAVTFFFIFQGIY